MKVACIQMDMVFCDPAENFRRVAQHIENAMAQAPDVIVLPELWNTGFFPKENLCALCDQAGDRVKKEIGGLAKRFGVNIVAGSVADLRDGKVYNTCYVFRRDGACIAAYDKTHLFSPMGEDRFFTKGDRICRFTLDDVPCGVILCSDLRFPELTRKLSLEGIDMLFLPCQWPEARLSHLHTLTAARAIENQIFLASCKSCGKAGATRFGGGSRILDPLGNILARADAGEQSITCDCDLSLLPRIRNAIPVFRDRNTVLYCEKL